MSPSDPPNVVTRIPRGVWWGTLVAFIAFLAQQALAMHDAILRIQIDKADATTALKACEDRQTTCVLALDEDGRGQCVFRDVAQPARK